LRCLGRASGLPRPTPTQAHLIAVELTDKTIEALAGSSGSWAVGSHAAAHVRCKRMQLTDLKWGRVRVRGGGRGAGERREGRCTGRQGERESVREGQGQPMA
jgi:hypothetical protein